MTEPCCHSGVEAGAKSAQSKREGSQATTGGGMSTLGWLLHQLDLGGTELLCFDLYFPMH